MFIWTNNNFAGESRYFVHFLAMVTPLRHETSYFHEPASWSNIREHNTKICRFLFPNLDNDRYGPKKISPGFAKLMKLNKIGEVWNSANRFLSDFIGLLSSKNFATMTT